MKKFYLESGFLDANFFIEDPNPFVFMNGARGIGKTYGFLEYFYKHKCKFLYMRRTQKQIDLCYQSEYNPYKKLNADHGWSVCAFPAGEGTGAFYEYELSENGKPIPVGEQLGYCFALSTFANLRSIDLTDVDIIFYDEFIKLAQERPIRQEANAFFNAVETIARNRELAGLPPLKVICASNSVSLNNDIYYKLRVVSICERMQRKGIEEYHDTARGLSIYIFNSSPISEAKRETALYKLTAGTDFTDMALNNQFTEDDTSAVNSKKLVEYRPLVKVADITIYKHKSKNEYYVSSHHSGTCKIYSGSDKDLSAFRKKYFYLLDSFILHDNFNFDSYGVQCSFLRYLDRQKY